MVKTLAHVGLALGMLVTGSINTLSTKLADLQNATGVGGGPSRNFSHPFTQAWFMFFGEFLCLLTFFLQRYVAGWRGRRKAVDTAKPFNPAIFILPALCDMCGTSLIYVGLNLSSASIFQMLRGSVVIFTGILSATWLKRTLHGFNWMGMGLVLVGAAVVGVASVDESGEGSVSNPVLGDVLIVSAQVVTAFQMCVEEKFLTGKDIPALQAVGWEGGW